MKKFILMLSIIFSFTSQEAGAVNVDIVEPSPPVVYVPIALGDLITIIPVLADNVPPEPVEVDNSSVLGGVDSDNDGIKDDVERWIALQFPGDAKKRRYAYSYAYYIRQLLLTTDRTQIQNNVVEMLKASVCLPNNEQDIVTIMGMHLNSQARFNRYAANADALTNSVMQINALSCVL
ncbi:hypothetical protein [Thalassomonas actiniarum]|uniref:Uncharacterized protein n=1 Tax=Thalassomonas actiniarum TaxID=485447 RepID=A0AAE9YQ34_9GAMM|nr:hypothetical protein [Thalassomonas actiniarum]WDD98163.1 hypothetical protein SG35_023245 [Thalassomonas actiniarum]